MSTRKPLTNWLRGQPNSVQATAYRVYCEDGIKTVALEVDGKYRFKNAAMTIEELAPTKIEALDHKGNVMRVRIFEPEPPAETEETPGDLSASEGGDPKLTQIARLIADAYKTGAEQHREMADNAFSKLVDLTSTAFGRLDALEKSITRQYMAQVQESARAAAHEEPEAADPMAMLGPLAPLLLSFLQGQMGGLARAAGVTIPAKADAVPAPAPHVNGSAEPKEDAS